MITTGHPARQSITRFAAWLAVVVVMLRAALAPGLMLDASAAARGEVRLVICTGAGLKVLPTLPAGDPSPAEHRLDQGLCPYAASTPLAIAVEPLVVLAAHFASAAPSAAPRDLAPVALPRTADARAPPRRA